MSDPAADAIDVAIAVARAIESVEGAYFVGGSLASSLQGEPRATNDIDIVVDVPLGRVSALAARRAVAFRARSTFRS